MNKHLIIRIFIIILLLFVGTLFILKKTSVNNEVTFWTLQMSDFSQYINGVINDFEKENPDIKIKWVDIPFSEGEKRTLASILSNTPPDLVNLNPDFSSTLASKGTLWEIPQNNVFRYNSEVLKSLLSQDGKLYMIPWYATSAVTIYNREILKKAGVPVPDNYEDIIKYAGNVKNTGAYIIFPNITENDTMLKNLNKYGISNLKDIDSEKSLKVFNMYKKLYQEGLIPAETVTVTLQESLEKYMSGNIALIEAGPNFLNMIKENSPSIYNKTDVSYQLKGDLGQYNFSLMNFVIPLRAKHKENALKFALYLTNNKNQLELAKLTNVIAVNKETLNNEFYTKYDENDLISKARVISASQLNHLQPVFKTRKNQKDINNIVNSATQSILLNKSSVKDELRKILKELNKLEG